MKTIIQQYIAQMAVFFLANIKERMRTATTQVDDVDMLGSMADFRTGFDRRLLLITINHVLLNLPKKMMDGSLFNRMLNVKNPGEWLTLTQNIRRDHFSIKNKSNFDEIKSRIIDFCQVRIFKAQYKRNK